MKVNHSEIKKIKSYYTTCHKCLQLILLVGLCNLCTRCYCTGIKWMKTVAQNYNNQIGANLWVNECVCVCMWHAASAIRAKTQLKFNGNRKSKLARRAGHRHKATTTACNRRLHVCIVVRVCVCMHVYMHILTHTDCHAQRNFEYFSSHDSLHKFN